MSTLGFELESMYCAGRAEGLGDHHGIGLMQLSRRSQRSSESTRLSSDYFPFLSVNRYGFSFLDQIGRSVYSNHGRYSELAGNSGRMRKVSTCLSNQCAY